MQWSFVEGQFAKAVFWVYTDAEARKRGEQEGLETLLVHADNVVFYPREKNLSRGSRFTPKNTAWGVRWQHWNSKELTGVHTSSGAWGLMRWYAQNLTNPSIPFLEWWGVLHGCRQFVICVLWFISETSKTRIHRKSLWRLPSRRGRKARMTSSPYGRYGLGCTCATMEASISDREGNLETILKGLPSSDRGLQLALVKEELRVIADQNAAVNTYLDLVHTARHTLEIFIRWSTGVL